MLLSNSGIPNLYKKKETALWFYNTMILSNMKVAALEWNSVVLYAHK